MNNRPQLSRNRRITVALQAIGLGILVLLAGTIPRNILFAANLRYGIQVPWAAPLMALYLTFFWRYLNGAGQPDANAQLRKNNLRAHRISNRTWCWALVAGIAGIIALVLALHVVNKLVLLPTQQLPDLSGIPKVTVLTLLLMGAPVAGIVEEAAFRGYMQGPLERVCGLPLAILVTGTLFAITHLDFTLILWPYYVAVAALYGVITYYARSILPAVVLHTAGNIYSSLDLWLHGRAEWQTGASGSALIRETGTDNIFWMQLVSFMALLLVSIWGCYQLARSSQP